MVTKNTAAEGRTYSCGRCLLEIDAGRPAGEAVAAVDRDHDGRERGVAPAGKP
jgi:hypothetical protein